MGSNVASAPAKGATTSGTAAVGVGAFQSTPPRRGRPKQMGQKCLSRVSIHAPAKGATERVVDGQRAALFQSTPPRRGRHGGLLICKACPWFQSTPPRRGRRIQKANAATGTGFNPRPREGGDTKKSPCRLRVPCFNPRPREGGDNTPRTATVTMKFQSTPPRRGRQGALNHASNCASFNPRPREGGDGHSVTQRNCCQKQIFSANLLANVLCLLNGTSEINLFCLLSIYYKLREPP